MGQKGSKSENSTKTTSSSSNLGISSSSSSSSSSISYNNNTSTSSSINSSQLNNSKTRSATVSSLPTFNPSKIDQLFASYEDNEEKGAIGPDGIMKLCSDLNIDPENIAILIFAWHLQAQRMGYFSKTEFTNGLLKIQVDSIASLKEKMKTFENDISDANKFKEFYKFAFIFSKPPESKVLELQTSIGLLQLLLNKSKYNHVQNFVDFLLQQTTYKALNLDQWLNFLEFSSTVNKDLSNYDEDGAWSVILDEYVQWFKQNVNEQNAGAQNY
eukprot:TRINITY_DN1459_c0_g3_i1.p1 TRINITY_DN1459_c0_g3~~TRINITY_DN1459_c0_g3_i1.p1  ORF type:complete len:271 (+),score=104.43 TRINITY_DN1459_c0_g3_i1:30-842(+)